MGATWSYESTDVYTTAGHLWSRIAVSSDSKYIIAVTLDDNKVIVKSSNSGGSWTNVNLQNAVGNYNGLWMSWDGKNVLVPDHTNDLYLSTNYATTFTKLNAGSDIQQATASEDATKLFMAAYNFGIYTSTNINGAATTWNLALSLPFSNWTGACASSDGTYIYFTDANAGSSGLYASSDGGNSFSVANNNGYTTSPMLDVACDSTGQYVHIVTSDILYFSQDYGATITQNYLDDFIAVAVTEDASRYAAMTTDGRVYYGDGTVGVYGSIFAENPDNSGYSTNCSYADAALDANDHMFGASYDGYLVRYDIAKDGVPKPTNYPSFAPTYTPTHVPTYTPTHVSSNEKDMKLLALIALVALIPICSVIFFIFKQNNNKKKGSNTTPSTYTVSSSIELVEVGDNEASKQL